MKKQLLIAAVAATMASVSMADISISGGAKVNYLNVDSTVNTSDSNSISHDVDFTIAGKNGATTVSATFATTGKTVAGSANTPGVGTNNVTTAAVASVPTSGGLITENVFLTTKIGDFNIKTGSYAGSDSNMGNGSRADGKISIDTTMSGIKLQFEDSDAAGNGSSVTVSGSVSGVALSHEVFNKATDTVVSGSFGGVNAKYRSYDFDGTNSGATTDKTSLVLSTEMNGVTLTYVDVDVAASGTTTSDDFFGTQATAVNDMSGFGVASSVAGNKIALKSYDIKQSSTAADDSYTKIIVTRPLASGSTFEATYTDADMATGADSVSLDLELAVKF